MRGGGSRLRIVPAAAFLLVAAGCTAGDPLGLYHPYHEPYASDAERGAAFAAHTVTYGTYARCGRKLAEFVADEAAGGHATEPVRISSNEMVGYRRFGAGGEGVVQEYRCIDGTMHFRAWTAAAAAH
jgi:hypothetical protein